MLITDDYREMQRKLHENPGYGVASVAYAPLVANVIRSVRATELLDYGAGKGRLGEALKAHIDTPLKITHYDPAVADWSQAPQPSAMVACVDVLEHIEPALLDNVLDDLKRVTLGHGIFTVHTAAAIKVLPDGRNAHLIQQPPRWWLPRFLDRFELLAFNRMPMGFWIMVERKRSDPAGHGATSVDYAPLVESMIRNVGAPALLDYGAGKSRLREVLRGQVETRYAGKWPFLGRLGAVLRGRKAAPLEIIPYDPDVAQWSRPPRPCEMVACIDLLERTEPDRLEAVLGDLERLTLKQGVITIGALAGTEAGPARHTAPLIQQPAGWWLAKIMDRFDLLTYNRMPMGFGVVVERKNTAPAAVR